MPAVRRQGGHLGKRHHGAARGENLVAIDGVSPEKSGVPLLTVNVPPVYEVICPVGIVAVPSMVRSVRARVVSTGEHCATRGHAE